MILPSFDEEAYMNKPNEHVPKPIPAHVMTPTDETANLAEEAGEIIAEVWQMYPRIPLMSFDAFFCFIFVRTCKDLFLFRLS